jgi:hypothetical protein
LTTKMTFTEACIRRAAQGARKAGLRVIAIRPDGTVVVDQGDGPLPGLAPPLPLPSKWDDVEA